MFCAAQGSVQVAGALLALILDSIRTRIEQPISRFIEIIEQPYQMSPVFRYSFDKPIIPKIVIPDYDQRSPDFPYFKSKFGRDFREYLWKIIDIDSRQFEIDFTTVNQNAVTVMIEYQAYRIP